MSKNIFIIAEAGVNHNGELNLGFRLIDKAWESGADAVKFQTFRAENLVSKNAARAEYQEKNMPEIKESQFQMLKRLELSFTDFIKLKEYCDKKKIIFLSTPFDFESVDFLNDLVPAFKISSGDLTNLPFLEYAAKKNKPVILSTGMSTLDEVRTAVSSIRKAQGCCGDSDFPALTLLHCSTNYPCPYKEVNLRALQALKDAFGLPVGYSDHTLGIEVSIAAAALGARVIEKHFTLDKNTAGPDHRASIEPDELKAMVKAIRNVEMSLGDGVKKPGINELRVSNVARRSLVAARDLKEDEIIQRDMLVIKRPGNGIQPSELEKVIGLKLKRDKQQDAILLWEDF
ncbi:MAG: N-acetylneuraminate synthase [Candidatus Omnitrophota bacterium]